MFTDISILMAFAAGIVSFLSPCVLPLVPGYVSFISGISISELNFDPERAVFLDRKHRTVVLTATFFIMGFSAVFILLGASATWIGAKLALKLGFMTKAAGLIIIFFGILKMGLVRPLFFLRDFRIPMQNQKTGFVGAVLLGAAFAFGWTPCIGPVLGGILTFAGTLDTVHQGVRLLLVYSLGLGLPFFLTALCVHRFFRFFNQIKKHLGLIEKISGLILVMMGILIYTNSLTLVQAWFPFLNRFTL
jgi:cytochrome c-type biogenesis protein